MHVARMDQIETAIGEPDTETVQTPLASAVQSRFTHHDLSSLAMTFRRCSSSVKSRALITAVPGRETEIPAAMLARRVAFSRCGSQVSAVANAATNVSPDPRY